MTNGTAIRQVSLFIKRDPITNDVDTISLNDTTFILKNLKHTTFKIVGNYLVISHKLNNGRLRLFDLSMPIIPDPADTPPGNDPYYNNITMILDIEANATALAIGDKVYFEKPAKD